MCNFSLSIHLVFRRQSNEKPAMTLDIIVYVKDLELDSKNCASENNLETFVQLWDIPYCLLDKRNYCFLPAPTAKPYNHINRYFGANSLEGREGTPETTHFPDPCKGCIFLNQCRFINRLYYDDNVAKESIKMLYGA